MRRWYRGVLAAGLLALGMVAGLGVQEAHRGTPVARAAQMWDVIVGTDVEEDWISTQDYFPSPLAVNVGDTVRFNFRGFHTVTFLSGEPVPPLVLPGTETGTLVLNARAFFPSLPPGATSATYNGTGFLNITAPEGGEEEGEASGPPPPFPVTFTAPGSFTYLCLIHPGMEGTIMVAPAGAALPETPAQADARGEAELETLITAMRADVALLRLAPPVTTGAGGQGAVHTALAGLGRADGVSKLAFLPERMSVRRGDVVVWAMPDPFEIHTVTFTSGAEPPEFVEPRFGPGGPGAGPPTLVIPANVANPAGGNVYTGRGYLNSGILTNGNTFALRFDAPAGSYEYLCLVHPFMTGTVTVTDK